MPREGANIEEGEKEEGLPALRWQLSGKERSRKGCRPYASSCRGRREGGRVAGLALAIVGEGEKEEGCQPKLAWWHTVPSFSYVVAVTGVITAFI